MAPAAKRPLRDAKQISRIGLGEFARFMPIQYAPELDHSHTLKGFRTAHPWPSKGPSITGPIVRYLNRTYHVLSTRCLSCAVCFECDNCFAACPEQAIIKLGPGKGYRLNDSLCTGCATCFEQCPCHAIQMVADTTSEGSPR